MSVPDYLLLPASQLPEIIRTDWTRRAGAVALAGPLLIELPEAVVPGVVAVPLVLAVPDPVVPAVLPAVEPAVVPLPVPAVPDVEPAPDVPAVEPAPAP